MLSHQYFENHLWCKNISSTNSRPRIYGTNLPECENNHDETKAATLKETESGLIEDRPTLHSFPHNQMCHCALAIQDLALQEQSSHPGNSKTRRPFARYSNRQNTMPKGKQQHATLY